MDPSDIRYILGLTKLTLLQNELQEMVDSLSYTILRLTNLCPLMKTLERDLQIPNYASYSSHLEKAKELLSLGRESIETLRDESYTRPT